MTHQLAIVQWRKACQGRCLPTVVRALAAAGSSCGHRTRLRASVLLEAITPRALKEAKQQFYKKYSWQDRQREFEHYEWRL